MSKIPRPFATWTSYAGHTGFDYPYTAGTPIRAGLAGRIIYASWFNDRNGYMKAIDHGNGVVERYYHLESLQGPKVGDWVADNGLIGYVGNTGSKSDGAHLHHEVWWMGRNQPGMPYWNYMDAYRYVGDGSATDEDKGDDMPLNTGDKQIIKDAILEFFEGVGAPRPGANWAFLKNPHAVDKQSVKDALFEYDNDVKASPGGRNRWDYEAELLRVASSSADTDALAKKIVALLPAGSLSKADVSDAIITALNNLVLRSVEQDL